MKPAPKKLNKRLALAVCLVAVVGLPSLMVYRELRHQRLNRQLIQAIKGRKEALAITLLHLGADGDAREDDAGHDTVGAIIRRFVNGLVHRGGQPSGGDHRQALALFYEVARAAEINYNADRGLSSEALPLALIRAGLPMEQTDGNGYVALYWAAHFHHHTVVRKLIALGANVNAVVQPQDETALVEADAQDTAVLLAHGANPNAADYEGVTALFTDDARKAELLIAAGASIDAVGGLHRTPLLRACESGLDDLALLLVRHGASLTARDYLGAAPFLLAADGCKLETLLALRTAGADPRAVDRNGTTALMMAVCNKDTRVFNWLMTQGIDINARGVGRSSVLSIAEQEYAASVAGRKPNAHYKELIVRLNALGATKDKSAELWYGEQGD